MMINLSVLFKLMMCLLSIFISGYASGHVSISPNEVPKDSYQKLTFIITHGCGDSPTKELIIFIPEEFRGAKPIPKFGWSIEIEKKDLERPYISHGKEIKSDVRKITWKGGKLPNEYVDEFSIRVKVIDKVRDVPVIIHQICEIGKWEWSELPVEGKKLRSPAPVLKIIESENHQHH